MTRHKSAVKEHPSLPEFVREFRRLFNVWAEDTTTTLDFHPQKSQERIYTIKAIRSSIDRLFQIVTREGKAPLWNQSSLETDDTPSDVMNRSFNIQYIAPGDLRRGGPRHDNDRASIQEISVAPTHQELICPIPPYLPGNVANAPHHLPTTSMERVLDIQFRLLREELL